ncbi:Winged helix-turn-helix DNA-binding domain protein [Raphanus sativus]|uniref:COP9 signalosome complex subunit 3 n=1 Tax=Raphanus sativus TaxID=3726 RepID=A0A9W3C6D3_RAPSA|nr:COP9 signalosome complex subunit 3-like [Raphanus sativus]KAJ4882776.1 Winged helix-turn-helix DNA-binding domain protein [Raphanus sativus]
MATNLQDEAFHDGIGEVFHISTLDWLNQPDLVAIYDRHHAIPLPLSIEKLGPGPIEEGIFLYARLRMRDHFEWDDVNEERRRNCRTGRTPAGAQVTHTEATLTMEDGHLFTRRNYHRGPNPFCLVHYLIRPPPVVNDESEDDGGGDEDESEDDGSGDEDESEDDGGGDEDESEDDGGGDEDESEDDGDAAEAGDGDAAEAGDGDAAEAGDGSEQDSTESEDDFKGDPDYDPNLDEQLDASNHSIGYLREEALTRDSVKKEKFFGVVLLIDRFINSCEAGQIRFATEKFVTLYKDPVQGVAPLLSAVRKVQVSAKCFTALHPDCLQLCLQAKCYEAGFSILSDDILEVDQPRDLYLYCYYGGMICIGLKRFQKASELLYNVVTAPMFQLNAIALEGYKKYILVTLIHSGQFTGSLPKCASTAAQRHLKSGCMPYSEVGNRYNDGKISELEAVAVAHSSDFEKDNNIGLVKQAVTSLYKRNILRLTQKYLTLSLQDIAQLANAKEAEMHVLQMIQEGQIHALINQKDGMVRFLEDPEQYKTSEMMIEVTDSVIQRTIGLSKNLLAMDESLSCDPLYLGKVGRERQKYDFGDGFDTVPQKFSM